MSTILLKNEITQADLAALERWMNNAAVTRYLNEHRQISAHLRAVREARLPVLTPLFNRDGRLLDDLRGRCARRLPARGLSSR